MGERPLGQLLSTVCSSHTETAKTNNICQHGPISHRWNVCYCTVRRINLAACISISISLKSNPSNAYVGDADEDLDEVKLNFVKMFLDADLDQSFL